MLKNRIITIVLVCLGCIFSSFSFTGCSDELHSVDIIDVKDVETLYAMSAQELRARQGVVYRVGTEYYSYFPSTGKIELVSQVTKYNKIDMEQIQVMFTDIANAQGVTEEEITRTLDTIDVFNTVVDSQTETLKRELDNCNAQIIIDNSNPDLVEYKEQLEIDLALLGSYKTKTEAQLALFMTCLQTDESTRVLAEIISTKIDDLHKSIVDDYMYKVKNATVTSADIEAVVDSINVQENVLNTIVTQYNDIMDILIHKDIALSVNKEVVQSIVDTDIYKDLENRLLKYTEEYEQQIMDMSNRVELLHKFGIDTLEQGRSNAKKLVNVYDNVVTEREYITNRLQYIETLLSNDTYAVNEVLQDEMDDLHNRLCIIEELLNDNTLETIAELFSEKENIEQQITDLCELQKDLRKTTNMRQVEQLVSAEETLNELLQNRVKETNLIVEEKINGTGITVEKAFEDAVTNAGISLDSTVTDTKTQVSNLITEGVTDTNALTDAQMEQLRTEIKSVLGEKLDIILEKNTGENAELKETIQEQLDADIQSIVQKLNTDLGSLRTDVTSTAQGTVTDTKTQVSNLITEGVTDTNALTDAQMEQLRTDIKSVLGEKIDIVLQKNTGENTELKETIQEQLDADIQSIVQKLNTDLGSLRTDVTSTTAGKESETKTQVSNLIMKSIGDTNTLTDAQMGQLRTDINSILGEKLDIILEKNTGENAELKEAIKKQLDTDVQNILQKLNTDLESLRTDVTSTTTGKETEFLNKNIEYLADVKKSLNDDIDLKVLSYVEKINLLDTELKKELQNAENGLVTQNQNVTAQISLLSGKVDTLNQNIDAYDVRSAAFVGLTDDAAVAAYNIKNTLQNATNKYLQLKTDVNNLIANPYVAPVATADILGEVKVDGTTIIADSDGTLRAAVGYNNLDTWYEVGTLYDTETDVPDKIKPYCTRVTETHTQEEQLVAVSKTSEVNTSVYSKLVITGTETKTVPDSKTVNTTKYNVTPTITVTYNNYNANGTFVGTSEETVTATVHGYSDGRLCMDSNILKSHPVHANPPSHTYAAGDTYGNGGTVTCSGGGYCEGYFESATTKQIKSIDATCPGTFYVGLNACMHADGTYNVSETIPYTEYGKEFWFFKEVSHTTGTSNGHSVNSWLWCSVNTFYFVPETTYGYKATNPYTGEVFDSGAIYSTESAVPSTKLFTGTKQVTVNVTKTMYGYKATNPYNSVEFDSGAVFETESEVPVKKEFTGVVQEPQNVEVVKYTYDREITDVQLQKLKAKSVITNTTDKSVWGAEMLAYVGSKWVYCGTPT